MFIPVTFMTVPMRVGMRTKKSKVLESDLLIVSPITLQMTMGCCESFLRFFKSNIDDISKLF